MKKDKKVESKKSRVMNPHQREFEEIADLGEESERRWNSRNNASQFGFDGIPVGNKRDTMSDLNTVSENETVDSISGGDAVTQASEISDFDTITDSNTLTSASVIEGAFPTTEASQREGRDFKAEGLSASETDRVSHADDASLGMFDESDEDTIKKYKEAHRKDNRTISKKSGSHEHRI